MRVRSAQCVRRSLFEHCLLVQLSRGLIVRERNADIDTVYTEM